MCCSQQIRFGLQSPQDIINCGVFHVYERALYKVGPWCQQQQQQQPCWPVAAWQAMTAVLF